MKHILVGIALVWISLISYGQPSEGRSFPSLKVKGKVSNGKENTPMQYVNVAVYSTRDDKLAGGTITDADGDFEINNIKPGEYYLKAEFIGFESHQTEKFRLTPENPEYTVPSITLGEKSVNISEVEVVSNGPSMRYEVDKKVITVDRLIAASGGSAVEVLKDVPSIETDIEGNVSLRGSSNFTVLIDGRQSPLSGSDALNQISASSIDKIEIITNPSAKYDPDGTSGIINIVTKKGKYKGISFISNVSIGNGRNTLENDNFNDFTYSGDIALTLKQKKFSTTLSLGTRNDGSTMTRTQYSEQGFDQISYREMDANGDFIRSMSNARAQIDYYLTEHNTIYIGGGFSDMSFIHDDTSRNKTYADFSLDTNYYMAIADFNVNPKNRDIVIGDRQEFGSRDHYLEGEFTFRKGDNSNIEETHQYNSNYYWDTVSTRVNKKATTAEDQTEYRLDLDYVRPVFNNSKLEAGALLRIDEKTTSYDVTEPEVLPIHYSFGYHRYIYGGYATFTGKLSDIPLNYSAGLRAEYTDRNLTNPAEPDTSYGYKKLDWYPTAALSYEFTNENTLQLTYSRRVQRPRDFMLNPITIMSDGFEAREGSPGLLPEYTDAVELNYQFVWGRSYLAIETYYRHTKNEFERVREVRESDSIIIHKMINLGKEDHMGIDISGNFKVTKWWTTSPSVSAYYNVAEGMYEDSLRTVTGYSGRGMFNNMFYITKTTQLQWNNSYRAPRQDIDGKSKGFFETNLAIRQDLLDRKLSVSLSIRDILGTASRHDITDEPGYYLDSTHKHQSPVFRFAISYKFNQDQRDRNGKNKQMENGENGEGSDMMF